APHAALRYGRGPARQLRLSGRVRPALPRRSLYEWERFALASNATAPSASRPNRFLRGRVARADGPRGHTWSAHGITTASVPDPASLPGPLQSASSGAHVRDGSPPPDAAAGGMPAGLRRLPGRLALAARRGPLRRPVPPARPGAVAGPAPRPGRLRGAAAPRSARAPDATRRPWRADALRPRGPPRCAGLARSGRTAPGGR